MALRAVGKRNRALNAAACCGGLSSGGLTKRHGALGREGRIKGADESVGDTAARAATSRLDAMPRKTRLAA